MNADPKKEMPGASASVATAEEPGFAWTVAPAGLFILLGVLFFWGTLYLDQHAGGFEPRVYAPYHSWKEVEALQPKDPAQKLYAKGKNLFGTYCAVCHQATGLGAPGIAPPLAGSEWPLAPGPNRVIRIVLNGLTGPVKVKGQEFNLVMVPFRDILTNDEDLAAVLTYIRSSKDWGHNASPVMPEQVKAIREKTAGKGLSPWTAAELMAIPDSDAPAAAANAAK